MKKAGNTWVTDNDHYFGSYFEGSDVFEQDNLELALSFCKNFKVAVDCGAHVGSWSRYMADRFDFVAAFEPNPDNFNCLVMNCPQNNVALFPMGLSNEDEEVSLEGGNNSGCWHVVPGKGIKLIRMPDFGRLDFIKIDAEGYEENVLRGITHQLIMYSPVVLIEEKALPHKPLDYGARKLLNSLGFRELAKIGRDVIFGN